MSKIAIKNTEYYTQKDGREILKVITSTPKYPNRYFYVDRYFEDLIRNYGWFIHSNGKNEYVGAHIGSHSLGSKGLILLHQEIANKCLGHHPVCTS